jgi:hypothetical protein
MGDGSGGGGVGKKGEEMKTVMACTVQRWKEFIRNIQTGFTESMIYTADKTDDGYIGEYAGIECYILRSNYIYREAIGDFCQGVQIGDMNVILSVGTHKHICPECGGVREEDGKEVLWTEAITITERRKLCERGGR